MNVKSALSSIRRTGYILVTAALLTCSTQAKDLAPYDYEHFFDPSRLVKIDITIDEADWDILRYQHRSLVRSLRTDIPPSEQEKQFDYFPATVTIDGTDIGKVAVRKKGFVGSMDDRRPSFKIQIDKFEKKKKFAGIDTLTLNNNKQDPSRVNQVIGYQLFREAGLPASHCNFAVVSVNGESLGVYCNVESTDKRFARRKFGTDKGAFYEGTLADFVDGFLIRYERKYGNPDFDGKLKEVADALKADDVSVIEELGKIIDLEKFYRYWAMEGLIGHWDGYVSNRNNYFIYYNPKSERIEFVPWGLDQLGEDNNFFWGGYTPPKSVKANGAIARRLYQIKDARNTYFTELNDLLDTVWKEDALIDQIKSLEEMIQPYRVAFGKDRRQTGIDLKDFISNRRSDINAELKNGHPDWTLAEQELPPGFGKWGDCEVTLSFKMPKLEKEGDEFTAVAGEANVTFISADGKKTSFKSTDLAMKQNRGWGGGSISLQISEPGDQGETPMTIEVTFPSKWGERERPIRLDVFASAGSGRLLSRKGNVGEDGTVGMMAGEIHLDRYGAAEGESVSGTLVGEFYSAH